MTEPQVWTMMAVFTTLMFGMLTIVSTLFIRVLRTEVGSLRAEVGGEMASLRAGFSGEMASLRGEMNARFDTVSTRIDNLDRDVQALVKHTFGIDRG